MVLATWLNALPLTSKGTAMRSVVLLVYILFLIISPCSFFNATASNRFSPYRPPLPSFDFVSAFRMLAAVYDNFEICRSIQPVLIEPVNNARISIVFRLLVLRGIQISNLSDRLITLQTYRIFLASMIIFQSRFIIIILIYEAN